MKKFDKIDYNPTIALKTPRLPDGFFMSLIVSVFVFIGPISIAKSLIGYVNLIQGTDFICSIYYIISLVILDWGSFIVAGFMIGKLYPEKSLLLTLVSAFLGIIIIIPNTNIFSDTTESIQQLYDCIFGYEDEGHDEYFLEGFKSGYIIGGVIGYIFRTYLALFFARISANKKMNFV